MPEPETSQPSLRDLIHLLNTFEEQGAQGEAAIIFQVESLGPDCLNEIGNRLLRPSVSGALKRFIYGLPQRLPWREWTPVLQRALMHENNPGLFEEGLRVLALMGGAEQTDALRAIALQRVEAPFSSVLQRKLEWLESRQGFDYHLKDLLLASRQPALAQRAADHLALLSRPEHLPALVEVAGTEDGYVSRLALRVLGNLKDPEAGAFLAARFKETGESQEEGRLLREALEPLRKLSPKAQAEQLLKRLKTALEGRASAATESLQAVLAQEGGDPRPDMEALRAVVSPGYETRLLEALEIALSDKPGRLGSLTAQVADNLRRNTPRLHGNLDECALGLVQQVRLGDLPEAVALGLLEWAYSRGLGGESVAWAFATLIDAKETRLLDLVLANPDHRSREAALVVLGEREDPDLLQFLFQATQDTITDLALKVTQFFGRLPGAFPMTLELLQGGNPDQIRHALRIIEANGWRTACEALVSLLGESPREDLLCDYVRVLGVLHYQPATPELLKLLHGGQSPRVLSALGDALAAIEQPAAALGFLEKAQPIRSDELQVKALQSLGRVFKGLDDPIPIAHLETVKNSLQFCLNEGERARLATVAVLPELYFLATTFYERQLVTLAGFLADQRKRPTWDRTQLEMVGAVLRTLELRLGELSALEAAANRLNDVVVQLGANPRCAPASIRDLLKLAGPESPLWQWPAQREGLNHLLAKGFTARGQDPETLLALCDLANRLRAPEVGAAARALFSRSGPESKLRAALGDLLRRSGQPMPEGEAASPLRELLVLEPNTFFRRRLLAVLQDRPLRIREARDRFEAEALLEETPADVLVSESADDAGPLYDWLMAQWQGWNVQRILLSTTQREPREVREAPWFHGSITKPYRSEMLLARLGL